MNDLSPDRSSSLLGVSLRTPPANIQAEQSLLGALLANNRAYDRVAAFLAPEHFADPINARIYQAIARRIEQGQLADAVTLKATFEHSGVLDEVGGTPYLAQLLGAMVGIINAGEYGRAIHDAWLRRRLIDVGETAVNAAFGGESDIDGAGQIERLDDEVSALQAAAATATGQGRARGFSTLGDAVHAASVDADEIASGRAPRPISTGLPVIDRVIGGGIVPDTLTFMLGAGAAGKSELALQIAEQVAQQAAATWLAAGKPGPCPGVLYIMLGNMTARQLGARSAARLSGVLLRDIRRGDIDMVAGERLVRGRDLALSIPLDISDTGPSTLARVLGDMRRAAKRRPLVLVVVDNFSDLLSVSADKMFATAVAATKGLKESGAQAMRTAVLLLMHINSSVDSGAKGRSPRPRPSDIPWGTKKDADFAFGLFRPVLYVEPEPPVAPAKLTATGEEVFAKMRQEWADKREPWPVGVRDVTEVVPMKMREQDSEDANAIGRLRFDRGRHTFVDLDAPADAPDAAPAPGLFGGF
jgi:replicative DNA helicase